ncbi:hypothetical protein IKQ21_01910 [bacterium]|nr:hypothetical protein [bacterium]
MGIGIDTISGKMRRKLSIVRQLDGINKDEFSQLELMILQRFIKEAQDDKVSVKNFKKLVCTDIKQEYECIIEKTADIRRMQKEKQNKFDTNT